MRLAILADIHGNIPALEAALKDVEQTGVDGLIVAGDMVVGPHSVEVVDRLRQLNARMIRGNNENYLLRLASGEAPDWWYTAHQWSFIRWNYGRMNEDTLNFIRDLPEQIVVHIAGTEPIRVTHGSPRSASESIDPEKDVENLTSALAMVPEPVLVFGHTHQAWQRRLDGRLALNPGSVCSTFDRQAGGSYVLLSWENQRWEVEFRDVLYDLTLIKKAFEETGLLKEVGAFAERWMNDIEKGTNCVQAFVNYAYKQAAEAGYADAPFVPDEIWDKANEQFEIDLAKGKINP